MSESEPPYPPWGDAGRAAIAPLAGSGFSGSRLFRLQRPDGTNWVLKSFGPHTSLPRAQWIHALMAHLRAGGLDTVPRVASVPGTGAAATGDTVVRGPGGELWELVEYMQGVPRRAPSATEAAAALSELSRLHAVAATLPGAEAAVEPSTGVDRRSDQAGRMLASPWRDLEASAGVDGALDDARSRLLTAVEIFETSNGRAALESIAAVGRLAVRTQPVLRDIWCDHVLFDAGGRPCGFIDFHAAGRDTTAVDVARLLGSWDATPVATLSSSPSVTDRWPSAIAACAQGREPEPRERLLIDWLHASAVICGLDNWFGWLIRDRRQFDDRQRVLARMDRLIAQLAGALHLVRDIRPGPRLTP